MADPSPSALDRALLAIGKLRAQLETSEKQRKTLEAALTARTEPIAIVGMGCRFPGGADDPAGYWRILEEGVDAVREIPASRWSPSETAQTGGPVRFAATLDDVETFDAEFFGISPREAVSLDPQQRLLLEVVWEALEDANIPADRLKGSDTGVFVGVWAPDYRKRVLEQDKDLLDAYCYTGNISCMVAGRVSYTFGFQGPSVAIDTACSSSLVAIHQACASLRAEESALAIAGGVGLLLSPESMDGLALLQALSPDGRCRTFDAGANGFVRGEGCGVVVLTRLADAVRRGDRILGVIRGSAVNQDGRSAGLTAPNLLAQKAVVQKALASAGVSPADIGYVEAHGTGTSLGDPIEVEALAAVLGAPRADGVKCLLGSVKANIGHLEAAAGVAGLMKAVLVLSHERVPRQPNFRALNPRIELEGTALAVAARDVAWPRGEVVRRAGVSSFGMSGTNAHVIIEEAPPPPPPPPPTSNARAAEVLVLSGRSEEALRAQARRYAAHLGAKPELAWADVCHTAAVGRSHFRYRLAVVAACAEDAAERLARFAKDGSADGVIHGRIEGTGRPKVAFLFTGQGSQYLGMGRTLYATQPVFRAALDRCAALADAHLEHPLIEVLFSDRIPGGLLDTTAYTQVALFALEYALSSLWQSWGVTPDVVVGHSVGEYVAACVAGIFSLDDGVRLIATRGRLMQALPLDGAMISVRLSLEEASALVEGGAEISVAAHNGPEHTILAGRREALKALSATLDARGVKTTWLQVSHAFHSSLIEPMLEAFERAFDGVTLSPPRLPLISNVTGKLAGEDVTKVSYWLRHARATVRFAEGMKTLDALGVDVSIELGPQPTLSALGAACLAGRPWIGLPSLRKGREEWAELLESVGQLYVRGVVVDWEGFDRPYARQRVALPTYAFQRERFWIEAGGKRDTKARAESEATGHPLLGSRVPLAGRKVVYETLLSRGEHAWLYDHRVGEAALMPGAGLAELVRAAGEHCLGEAVEVSSLVLPAPLVLPELDGRRVQVLVSAEEDRTEVTVHSQPVDASADAEWTLHASGEVRRLNIVAAPRLDLVAVRSRCAEAVDVAQAYEELAAAGMIYGPAFRGLRSLWVGKDEAFAEAVLPDGVEEAEQYGIHPALLDAAFHAMLGIADRSSRHLPFAMDQVVVHAVGTKAAWVHARTRPDDDASEGLLVDVTLSDAQGEVLVEVSGLRVRPAKEISLQPQAGGVGNAIHHVGWSKVAAPAEAKLSGRWLVVAEQDDATGAAVVDGLRHAGAECIVVDADGLASALPADHVVVLWSRGTDEGDAEGAHRMASVGLSMVQLLAQQERSPRLWWVTRGAMPVTAAEGAEVAQASLWGLGRTVMQEHPELDCTLVDVEGVAVDVEGVADAATLLRELGAVDGEREIALRTGERYAARLKRPGGIGVPEAENYILAIKRKGALDDLALVPAPRRQPERGEVEIEVRMAGLNFRDVLNALGMYPGEAGPLGGECSGIVTAVGEGVSEVVVGDRVMALAPASFGRYVVTDARLVARVPEGVSLAQAATIPITFLTAWYALHDLAGLKAGERLLVHAAAGGVGMAAVQVARSMGAEVFGTASPSKWDAVRSLGVQTVGNSRDLSFVEAIRGATGEAGVDVVLNALSGSFVDASLSLLGPSGRFIEMGKTDIRDASAVAASHPGVHYRAFDLMEAGVDRLGAMLASIVEGLKAGHFAPLSVQTFALTEAEAAFRFMAQARHVGKVVLAPPRALRTDGTVLITGGLGALGLHVARWLAHRGTKHLVLTGRRGLATPGAAEAVAELEAAGARVTVSAVDVSDGAAVRGMLAAIPPELPLRGVVHSAGALDDGVLSEQSAERLARVMGPKVDGACHLDILTREADLDVFVLFSSIAGTLGSAGQGGYAAANACLDALAARRRASGLAAQSLAWGPWIDATSQAGMVAGLDRAQQARLKKSGFGAIDPVQGMALTAAALERREAQLVLTPLELGVLRRRFTDMVPPLWRELVRVARRAAAAGRAAWAHELALLPEKEREAAVLAMVRGEVARVLSLPGGDAVEPDRPLKELGLDSLMAMELRNAMGRRAGASLPATLAFDHPTAAAIAKHILVKLGIGVRALSNEPIAPEEQMSAADALDFIRDEYERSLGDG